MKHEGIGGVTRFIVMNSVFDSTVSFDPLEKYDLKGSTFGRSVPEEMKSKVSTHKDLDLLQTGRKLYIPAKLLGPLKEQLTEDSAFLAEHDVMDYSLLVGIHYETEKNAEELSRRRDELREEEETESRCLFQRHDGCIAGVNPAEGFRKEYYLLGIIDFLVQYGAKKKFESFFRGTIGGAGDTLSVVKPKLYSTRFIEFMTIKLLAEVPSSKAPKKTSSARKGTEVKPLKEEEEKETRVPRGDSTPTPQSKEKEKDRDKDRERGAKEKKPYAST